MVTFEQFMARVNTTDSCWEWQGSKTAGGYGNLRWHGKNDYAHRVAYRQYKGAIPTGLQLDHLCRNRGCVNPDHLEAVTAAENVRRGASPYSAVRTTCRHGHDVTNPANVYVEPSGNHRCRVCASIANAQRTAARQANGDGRKVLRSHCKFGHAFDAKNTGHGGGKRVCKACDAARARRYRMEKAR